jgi:4'-phosphopantetheinyl transferase
LNFSLSRSESKALVAISDKYEVGIDLERIRPIPEWRSITSGFFTSGELAYLDGLGKAAGTHFLRLWTLKEAVLKTTGDGLSGSLSDFEFIVDASGNLGLHWLRTNLDHWIVIPFEPIEGYTAALSLRRPVQHDHT